MDLFSQAEHDELAQSILLCPDAGYIAQVKAEIDRLLPGMPRRDVIRASLEGRGALILTRSMDEACEISNRIAPEHLEVSSRDPQRWEPLLRHAGAIFLGAYTSESLGDYCAGPNHVLPTSGTARFSSPLGVYDFQKRSSIIESQRAGRTDARKRLLSSWHAVKACTRMRRPRRCASMAIHQKMEIDTNFVLQETRVARTSWTNHVETAMKNVTVTMEDSVADWARLEAARRNTSVSRLVGELLAEKMRHDDEYERAMNDWLDRKRKYKSNGAAYAKRDELHDRSLR